MDDETLCRDCVEDIIRALSKMLGPTIALSQAEKVQGLAIDNNGVVLEIGEDPNSVVNNLVDVYVEVSGDVVNDVLETIFTKYPSIVVSKR